MQIAKTYYFDDFRCIASACPDSCCKEWDVLVDGEYREDERDITLKYRGSRNQRVIDLRKSEYVVDRKSKKLVVKPVLWEGDKDGEKERT